MKQPELGKRIAELRQQKNFTQEELVEICNVSVRTIQRIESGEVTPRISTIKILLAALETNLDDFNKESLTDNQSIGYLFSSESWLQISWIAGLVYFILGFIDTFIELSRMEDNDLDVSLSLYLPLKITFWLSYTLFMMGFVKLGDFFRNTLLPISCYILVGLFTLQTGAEVFSVFVDIKDEDWIVLGTAELISFGAAGIVFGIGLLKLQDSMGTSAKVAGILEIVAGGCFMLVFMFFAGFIIYIPAIIIEIILQFKGYEYIRSERMESLNEN